MVPSPFPESAHGSPEKMNRPTPTIWNMDLFRTPKTRIWVIFAPFGEFLTFEAVKMGL
jgi:hypothetical protein